MAAEEATTIRIRMKVGVQVEVEGALLGVLPLLVKERVKVEEEEEEEEAAATTIKTTRNQNTP